METKKSEQNGSVELPVKKGEHVTVNILAVRTVIDKMALMTGLDGGYGEFELITTILVARHFGMVYIDFEKKYEVENAGVYSDSEMFCVITRK